ncbi:MAG: NUDIX hydrolase [Bdellovibrionales bacterium]
MLDITAARALIAAHTPFDALEAASIERVLGWIDSSPTPPITRKHFSPGHVTVAAWIVAQDTGRVLIVHHVKSGRWFQPGGHIEDTDMTLLDGALREVEEECGFLPEFAEPPRLYDVDVHPIAAVKDEPDHLHCDVRFLFVIPREIEKLNGTSTAQWLELEVAKERMGLSVHNNRLFQKMALAA